MSENKEKRNLDNYKAEMLVHIKKFLMEYSKTIEKHENNLEMSHIANLYIPIVDIIMNVFFMLSKFLDTAPNITSMLNTIEELTLIGLAEKESQSNPRSTNKH